MHRKQNLRLIGLILAIGLLASASILITHAHSAEPLIPSIGPAFQPATKASAKHVQARVLSDVSTFTPGSSFFVAVELTLDPDWHVYWSNPGDSGLPTTLALDLPGGLIADPAILPSPSKFILPGDIVMYGYEKSVIIGVRVHAPIMQPLDQPVTLTANVRWLACNDQVCIPGRASLPLTLKVGTKAVPDPDTKLLITRWRGASPSSGLDSIVNVKLIHGLSGIENDLQKTADNTLEFRTVVTWRDQERFKPAEWFPMGDPALVFSAPKSVQTTEKIDGQEVTVQTITTTATILQGQTPAPEQLGLVVIPCDDGIRRSIQTWGKIPTKWQLFPNQGQ